MLKRYYLQWKTELARKDKYKKQSKCSVVSVKQVATMQKKLALSCPVASSLSS